MKHSWFRKFLSALLVVSVLFAAAGWLFPCEWKPDEGARFKIAATQVKRDRSYYWVTVHLRKNGGKNHDMEKPVRLVLADSREEMPADTTFAGGQADGTSEIWFRFWVKEADLGGPLSLKLNDGTLTVKTSQGVPRIADGMMRTFSNPRW